MAIYYVWSAAGGAANGSSWANAFTTLTLALATEAAGDTLYVAHDHAESTAAIVTLNSSGTVGNPTKIVCVDRAGTVPPVAADRRATAQVTTTGNSLLNFGTGFTHYDGIIFTAGSGATGTASIQCGAGSAQGWLRFDNCSLRLGSTGTSSRIQLGAATNVFTFLVDLNNTTVSFNATAQGITLNRVIWRNTPSALLGTMPTTLFLLVASRGGINEFIGVDFSAAGSGKTLVGALINCDAISLRFIDCKLNAAVTKSTVPLSHGGAEIDFIRSGSAGVNYTVHRHRISGLLIEETTIIRTGGASDGVTPISWNITTTANCNYSISFECPVIAIWNDTTGSAVTATVEGIWGGGAVPLDDEVWLDVEYLGDASSPLGSFVNDGKANLLATAANQTSSSETWGGSTTKFKLAVTFTAQQAGWIYARVKCAKASTTFYVDPLVTLS